MPAINRTFIGIPILSTFVQSSLPGAPWKYAKINTDGKIPIKANKDNVG